MFGRKKVFQLVENNRNKINSVWLSERLFQHNCSFIHINNFECIDLSLELGIVQYADDMFTEFRFRGSFLDEPPQ